MLLGSLRRVFIGPPLPSSRQAHERLSNLLALPVFSSDALSSVAYGPEEIIVALAVIGAGFWAGSLPIAIAIAVLIGIVAISYRQTIHAYPHGGGSYTVAKENLGVGWGLVAAASLMTDYVLTVAVSVAAGVAALISAVPDWSPHRTTICVVSVAIVAFANLRGLRESGTLFAIPTYTFIGSFTLLCVVGLYKAFTAPVHPIVPLNYEMPVLHPLGLFIILKAFSSGCCALTGIEAIANGIPAFRSPESRNAAFTMSIMAIILATLVVTISYLAHLYRAVPGTFLMDYSRELGNLPNYASLQHQTLVSQIAEQVFHRGKFYFLIQGATTAILILAANTAFQDFPRLGSILARDRFAPRQLTRIGDRLVFSNGIFLLSGLAVGLLILFKGDTHLLIPLYAVGVFVSFTLSQYGMAVRQKRLKQPRWQYTYALSLIGGTVTGVVTLVTAYTKFTHGAFIVIFLIPVLVFVFRKIHGHYIELGEQLRITNENFSPPAPVRTTSIVLTSGIHRGVLPALEYARTLSHDCRALYIDIDPAEARIIKEKWEQFGLDVPLVILHSPYRSVVGPMLEYIEEAKKERPDHIITVVVPEFVPVKWWHKLLHHQSGALLKLMLMFRRGIVTVNYRYYLER